MKQETTLPDLLTGNTCLQNCTKHANVPPGARNAKVARFAAARGLLMLTSQWEQVWGHIRGEKREGGTIRHRERPAYVDLPMGASVGTHPGRETRRWHASPQREACIC